MSPGQQSRPGAWHVAVLVENLPLGVDTRLRKQVDDLLAAGFRVSVVTRRHPDNAPYRGRDGLTLLEHRPPPEGSGTLGYAAEYAVAFTLASSRLLLLRLRGRVDVLQLCQPPDIYFPLAWVLRLLGARIVVDQRDLMPELLASRTDRPSRVMTAVLRMLERETRRAAHHVVTVNDHLRRRLGGDLAATPVTVVRNGPVLRRADQVGEAPRAGRHARTRVVWAGKIGRQDRVDLVLRVAQEVVRRRGRADCEFEVLGDGECLEELRDLAHSLGLDGFVTFSGWLGERELFAHLAAADIGLDTSLQHEVSPVKAMEYFAFALPLACFDLQETRRLAEGAASFAPPGDVEALADALLGLVDAPAERRAKGACGRRMLEELLCWEKQSPAYVAAVSPPASAPRTTGPQGAA
jgi:glycosyltransferase involved in cell wall biosynthesis